LEIKKKFISTLILIHSNDDNNIRHIRNIYIQEKRFTAIGLTNELLSNLSGNVSVIWFSMVHCRMD